MEYAFGDFILDLNRGELRGAGGPVSMEPRVFALLTYMLENQGRLVAKEELVNSVWEGRIVSDSAISTAIKAARRAMDDDGNEQTWLKTVRGRGFRFEGHVRVRRSTDGTAPRTHEGSEVPRRAMAPITRQSRPSLAVLPFDEFGVADSDMFADGVVEEVTAALSRVRDFHVIARQSAFALQGERLEIPEISRRLGAEYLVEGSIRRAGERVRITVQLVSGSEGHTLWSERFDDRLDDLFELQDRIAAQVAGQLSPNLRAAEIARISTYAPEDRSAYELYLSALPYFWKSSRADLIEAGNLLDRAIALKPDYAPALAYRAWATAHMPIYMWSDTPEEDHEQALRLADEATRHAGNHAPSLVAISAAYSFSAPKGSLSLTYAERALEVDPNNAWAWLRRAWCDVAAGRGAAAVEALNHAEALSPLDPFRFSMVTARAAAMRHLGDPEAAVRLHRQAMRENPGAKWVRRSLLLSLVVAGRIDEALFERDLLLRDYPGMTMRRFLASYPKSFWEGNTSDMEYLQVLDLPND